MGNLLRDKSGAKGSLKYKVFIDGRAGTTGLRIEGLLSGRDDIQLIGIDDAKRKDVPERLSKIEEADVAFLCLPDEGSRDIVAALDGKARGDGPESGAARARIIDASTAHRTSADWVYGMPELEPGMRGRIASAKRVAMAGCHASGFILLVRPLIDAGLVSGDYPFTVFSLTGYSGGGKSMIAEYEGAGAGCKPIAPRQYAMDQRHKHLPEMTMMSGVGEPPVFSPVVADYYAGIELTVPLRMDAVARFNPEGAPRVTKDDIADALAARYADEAFIHVTEAGQAGKPGGDAGYGALGASVMSGRDDMEIFVYGNDERVLLVARYDNLGKGASGSGVQCMNLMLGLPERSGLTVE
jgi:N-acetyl-gamma-glutamyl-phosphate reductase